MDQKCLPSWRNPARYPTSPDADAFVHASHLMGGVHQRGGRRAAHRAAHRGAVGPERSGRSILKITSLCRCAGPQEAAFCVLRAMRHRGCYGISGRVFEHRVSNSEATQRCKHAFPSKLALIIGPWHCYPPIKHTWEHLQSAGSSVIRSWSLSMLQTLDGHVPAKYGFWREASH